MYLRLEWFKLAIATAIFQRRANHSKILFSGTLLLHCVTLVTTGRHLVILVLEKLYDFAQNWMLRDTFRRMWSKIRPKIPLWVFFRAKKSILTNWFTPGASEKVAWNLEYLRVDPIPYPKPIPYPYPISYSFPIPYPNQFRTRTKGKNLEYGIGSGTELVS